MWVVKSYAFARREQSREREEGGKVPAARVCNPDDRPSNSGIDSVYKDQSHQKVELGRELNNKIRGEGEKRSYLLLGLNKEKLVRVVAVTRLIISM